MKKVIKWIIIIVAILIVVGLVLNFFNKKENIEYVTAKIERGDLIQTVSETGFVESAEKIDLKFKVAGRILQVLIKVGDKVNENQVLARLDSSALSSQVENARANLKSAEADLTKVKAGASSQDVKVSEESVASAKANLESAQTQLNNLHNEKEKKMTSLREDAIADLQNQIFIAQSSLDTINKTLTDEDAKYTLSSQDTSKLTMANESYNKALRAWEVSKNVVNQISDQSSDAIIIASIDSLISTMNLISIGLTKIFDVLLSTPTSYYLTATELDALKSGITFAQTGAYGIGSGIAVLNIDKSGLITTGQSYDSGISEAQKSVASRQAGLNLAEAQLNLKKAGPRDFEITSAEAKVSQARASLNLAKANLNDTIIFAPMNGIITEINYQKGEQVNLSETAISLIGNADFEIQVDIPESDIAKIKVDQKVKITLDAFGDEKVFYGNIVFIDPAETIIQDVVYYQVKVQFEDGKDEVKSGMTANVDIQTARKNNVLFAPIRAVKQKNGDKVVDIFVNNEVIEKKVTTGLKGDDGIEILSGLEESEEVITFIKK